MKLFVHVYEGVPAITVEVDSIDEPFDTLKHKAKKLANLSPEQPVMLLTEVLSLGQKIGLSVVGYDPFPLVPSPPPSIDPDQLQINIRFLYENNKTHSVEVLRSQTILNLKSLMFNKEKEAIGAPSSQRFFFAGMLLEHPHTLAYYNIYEGSTLDLVRLCQDEVIVTIQTISGKTFPVDIYYCRTSRNMKDLIQQQQGIPIDQNHKLCYNGEVLDDNRRLRYYQISNRSTLLLVDEDSLIPRMLHINVEIVATGKIVRLQVKSSDTIKTVKAKIQDQEDIPIAKQMLYLPERRLMDDSTLADYYIWDNSTFYLAQSQTQTPPPPPG